MNVTSDVARVPGWYGKLPTLGDFASRRLEADFIEPWDLWLGESLQAQRGAFGEAWLDAYLDTPPWRFLLSPGALRGVRPELAFAGVLVPSVDRVGRHFPLTLVASLARLPVLAAGFDALLSWLHRLEDTALDALQGEWTIEELEDALVDLAPPGGAEGPAEDPVGAVRRALADAVARRGGFVDIAGISSRADLAAIFAPTPGPPVSQPAPMRGLAVWIADTPGRPQLLVSDGLPNIDDFIRMFSGGSGARSTRGPGGAPALAAEDPLATRPQGLGPPLTAPAATAGQDDLLSLFGQAAPSAATGQPAPRELLPDDDILALFKVDPDSVPGRLEPAEPAIPEHDVLGGFEPVGSPEVSAAAPAPNDDILAMFSAGEALPAEIGAEPAPANDPLGLFEVPPETRPFGEAPAAPPPTGNGEPDILDMFGIAATKPVGKEAK